MPLYEYTCRECQARFEELVSINDSEKKPTCPKCGSVNTERMMSTFAAPNVQSSSSCGTGGGGFT